jgi:hypothetical protein
MKPALSSWVLLFFFLTGGLATDSYQRENCTRIISDQFVSWDQPDASRNSSTIRRFRANSRKFVAAAQTATASRISAPFGLPYGTIRRPALISTPTLRALNVVLQV